MQPTPWFPRRDLPISLRVLGGRFFSWFHRLQGSKHVLRRDVQARLSQSGTHHSSWRIFRWTCLPKGKGSFGDDMYVFVDGFLGSPPHRKKMTKLPQAKKISPNMCLFEMIPKSNFSKWKGRCFDMFLLHSKRTARRLTFGKIPSSGPLPPPRV